MYNCQEKNDVLGNYVVACELTDLFILEEFSNYLDAQKFCDILFNTYNDIVHIEISYC